MLGLLSQLHASIPFPKTRFNDGLYALATFHLKISSFKFELALIKFHMEAGIVVCS